MPIHIDVRVNDKPITSLHIGRISGGENENDVNGYLVTETAYGEVPFWDKEVVQFMHRYGDGIKVCVQKGVAALIQNEKASKNDDTMEEKKSTAGIEIDFTSEELMLIASAMTAKNMTFNEFIDAAIKHAVEEFKKT